MFSNFSRPLLTPRSPLMFQWLIEGMSKHHQLSRGLILICLNLKLVAEESQKKCLKPWCSSLVAQLWSLQVSKSNQKQFKKLLILKALEEMSQRQSKERNFSINLLCWIKQLQLETFSLQEWVSSSLNIWSPVKGALEATVAQDPRPNTSENSIPEWRLVLSSSTLMKFLRELRSNPGASKWLIKTL